MLWMRLMKRVFFVAYLFSLANLVQNTTGGQLEDQHPLSVHTLGNVPKLDASYGASELLVLCVLLWGLFEALRLVRSHLAALLFPLEELQLLPPPKRSQAYALRQQTRKFVDGQHYKGAEHELKACSPCKEAVVAAKAAEQTRLNDRRRLDEASAL